MSLIGQRHTLLSDWICPFGYRHMGICASKVNGRVFVQYVADSCYCTAPFTLYTMIINRAETEQIFCDYRSSLWVNAHRWNKSPRTKPRSKTSCLFSRNPLPSSPETLQRKIYKRPTTLQVEADKERAWRKNTHVPQIWKGLTVDTSPHVRGPASVRLSLPPHHSCPSTTRPTHDEKLCTPMFKSFNTHSITDSKRAMELIMLCMMLRKEISGTLFKPLYFFSCGLACV